MIVKYPLISFFTFSGEDHFAGTTLTNLGGVYSGLSDYNTSARCYFEGLELLQKCSARIEVANTLGLIAILYRYLENYPQSTKYFLESLRLFDEIEDPGRALMMRGNFGIMLYNQGLYEEAKVYLQQATKAFQDLHLIVEECQFNFYIAQIFLKEGELDKVKEMAFRNYQVFCEHNRNDEIPNGLRVLGDLYSNPGFAEHSLEVAEQYYLQSIEKFVELGSKTGVYTAIHHIAQFYKQHNRWEEYAAHIEKAIEVYKEVQTEAVQRQADRFGWEQKIAEMEKAKEIERVRAEEEKKALEQQVDAQRREVENMIHELVSKNGLLHEISKDVKILSKHTIKEGQDVVERLLERLERSIIPLDQKKDLEQQLSEVHSTFMDQLQRKQPSLTTMELKICALLKMNLTSSNICSILFLSKRTIEFHRLNIRKKMGLGKSDDLHLVLGAIAEAG